MDGPMATSGPAIEALVQGRHGDPFTLLGPHDGLVWSFQPGADEMVAVSPEGEILAKLERRDAAGVFAGPLPSGTRYRLRANWGGTWHEFEDPYRFGPQLSEFDLYLLAEGTHERAYEVLGAHITEVEGITGTRFAVWAPNAQRVSVVGGFNVWDGRRHPMRLRREAGIWELFVPGVAKGEVYKYELLGPHGNLLPLKADPYAFAAERAPETGSIVWPLPAPRPPEMGGQGLHDPISIYEVHAGSWRRGEGNRYLTFREMARELVPYVRDMGFTHLELLPIAKHPFDGSWGYQPTGLYAPTARFGTPEDFRALVDAAHDAGLKLLVDWVPGHFPKDEHGLARFDGTALYEHEDPRMGEHTDWGTLIYNYGRREVEAFLVANALFWCERYGVDGLRVDAVASMIYRDYSRKHGEWIPNRWGGNENEEATAFLRHMNERLFGRFPQASTFAEESTAWPNVSRPTWMGGLGFGFKWNMGWMHDTLAYMHEEPVHRRWHHDKLTFGLVYAFTENFVLPLSHDEVVHGKGSLINKMPGDEWQKFANLRAYYGFMWSHPGKKLLFMGGEFAQWAEWNHDKGLDWHLLEEPRHRGMQSLVRDLNRLYASVPALHALDCDPNGFEWVDLGDRDASVLTFLRKGRDRGEVALVVCNFTPVVRQDFRVGVPEGGYWHERLNTDAEGYGGSNVGNGGGAWAEEVPANGRAWSLNLSLPPLSTMIFTLDRNSR